MPEFENRKDEDIESDDYMIVIPGNGIYENEPIDLGSGFDGFGDFITQLQNAKASGRETENITEATAKKIAGCDNFSFLKRRGSVEF